MSDKQKDKAIIYTLIERFNTQRLPCALEMKKRLDRGEVLDDYDHKTLDDILEVINKIRPLIDRNPEYEQLFTKIVNLWVNIIEQAIKNSL